NRAESAVPAKLAFQPDLLFVAVDGGSVIGSVMAGYDGHRGWLYSVAVREGGRHGACPSRGTSPARAGLRQDKPAGSRDERGGGSVLRAPGIPDRRPHQSRPPPLATGTHMKRTLQFVAVSAAALLLTACATQVSGTVLSDQDTPGFLLGLWHG